LQAPASCFSSEAGIFTGDLKERFSRFWHGYRALTFASREGLDPETAMHQASILFTFAVMAMAGAWYVMQDMSGRDAVPDAAAQTAAISAPAVLSE
jgi:hypothetical protein